MKKKVCHYSVTNILDTRKMFLCHVRRDIKTSFDCILPLNPYYHISSLHPPLPNFVENSEFTAEGYLGSSRVVRHLCQLSCFQSKFGHVKRGPCVLYFHGPLFFYISGNFTAIFLYHSSFVHLHVKPKQQLMPCPT